MSEVQDILVYGVMGIGNFILMMPALQALREGTPDARIALLANGRGIQPIAASSGLFDEVLQLPHGFRRNPAYIPWVWKQIRGRFDLLMVPPQGTTWALLPVTLLSKAPYRLALTRRDSYFAPLPWAYNHRIKVAEVEHEAATVARMVEYLGFGTPDLKVRPFITDEDRRHAQHHLSRSGVDRRRPRIVIHAGSSRGQPWKRWPITHFAALCRCLAEEQGAQVLFVGSGQEREELLAAFAGIAGPETILAGQLDIRATTALVESADLVVANDSAISHLAAVTGTALVVLFGPTDERVCGPLGERCHIVASGASCRPCYGLCRTKRVRRCRGRVCLTGISVEQVHDACVRALAGEFDMPAATAGRAWGRASQA